MSKFADCPYIYIDIITKQNLFTNILLENDNFLEVVYCFLKKYSALLAPNSSEGCSILLMTTQEPPFAMPFTKTKKQTSLMIETTHSQ